MKSKTFNIKYRGQKLIVEQASDANDLIYYKVSFPGGKQLDVYITPEIDGNVSNWAEGTGEKTDQAREIGKLIEEYGN